MCIDSGKCGHRVADAQTDLFRRAGPQSQRSRRRAGKELALRRITMTDEWAIAKRYMSVESLKTPVLTAICPVDPRPAIDAAMGAAAG
jgi:hypothetical protein